METTYCIQEEEIKDSDWRNESAHIQYGRKLSELQKKELQTLIDQYPEVIRKQPGRTKITEHKIPTIHHVDKNLSNTSHIQKYGNERIGGNGSRRNH